MRKNALVNIKNDDEECFKWHATIGYFNLQDECSTSDKVTEELRKYAEQLNFNEIEFPTPCSERVFKKFEKNNNVSLRVFGCEILPNNTNIIPLYVSKEKREKVVRLFFYENEDGTKGHYCTVKDMSRLVSSQYSKKRARRNICDFCLNPFGRRDLLDKHVEYCSKHDAVNTIMPKPGRNILEFKNIQNALECPKNLL